MSDRVSGPSRETSARTVASAEDPDRPPGAGSERHGTQGFRTGAKSGAGSYALPPRTTRGEPGRVEGPYRGPHKTRPNEGIRFFELRHLWTKEGERREFGLAFL